LLARECIQNVIAASENFARPRFPALTDAIDEAVPVVVDFSRWELRQNSLRFFFATITT
jgi:hypothetical protein